MFDLLLPQIFLGAAQRRLAESGVPIFTYHSLGVPPAGTRDPFLYVAAGRFDAQLAALRAAGFASADLSSVPRESHDRRVVITFDDGCANVLTHALEPLARHGFRAIEFLVAGLIGGRNEWDARHGDAPVPLMDAAQIRDWLAAGHSIGSHSVTHPNLTRCSAAQAREEIFASKQRLEDQFGAPVLHFCYPHGRWSEQLRDLTGEAGYETACTTDFGVNDRTAHPLALRRISPLSTGALLGKALHRLRRRVWTGGRASAARCA